MMQPIENLMQTSMEQIRKMVDVNTVVGEPIFSAGETMILPVSKVCLGFLVGGGEYGNMSASKKCADEARHDGNYPFAGATAVGMCITPLAFLTVEEGNVRVLPANQKTPVDRLIDIIPQAVKSIEKFVQSGIDCKKNGSEKQQESNMRGPAERSGAEAASNAAADSSSNE